MRATRIRRRIQLLLLCLLLMLLASLTQAAEQQPVHVLVIYDSLAMETTKEGNVAVLQRLLAAYGVKVTLVQLDEYKQDSMLSYTKVITVINAVDLVPDNPAYLHDLQQFTGAYLHIGANPPAIVRNELKVETAIAINETIHIAAADYAQANIPVDHMPYVTQAGSSTFGSISLKSRSMQSPYSVYDNRYTYVPYLQKGNASELALASVLKQWLAIPKAGQTYLVLKDIYPFSDLDLLEEMADRLYKAGVPFVLSVRPVFSNTEFPAMKRYAEALKYAQSRNGSIIVNAPVVMETASRSEVALKDKMEGFIHVLVDNGIAPLAIGAESYWSYDKKYADEGMSFFQSAVLFADEKPIYMDRTNTSKPFSSVLYTVDPVFLQQLDTISKAMPAFPMDTAVTMPFFENKTQLEEGLKRIEQSWISFADYKGSLHEVRTSAYTIASQHGAVTINGETINLDYAPKMVSADYEYAQKQQQSFKRLFSIQNQIFVVLIIMSLLIFGVFIVIGNQLYKRKYLK